MSDDSEVQINIQLHDEGNPSTVVDGFESNHTALEERDAAVLSPGGREMLDGDLSDAPLRRPGRSVRPDLSTTRGKRRLRTERIEDSDSDQEISTQRNNHYAFGDVNYSPVPNGMRRVGLPSMKPDPYDGRDDWEQYISHFLNCAALGRWSEETKLLMLSFCLKGSARTFYIGLSDQDRMSYKRLVKRLEERFGSLKQQSRYLARFETRRRLQGETIASFGDDLRLIAQRAYPNIGTLGQESVALNQFYKSLSPEMKCRCIDRRCASIFEAVDVVEQYESIMEGSANRKAVRAVASAPDNTTVPDLQQLVTKLDLLMTRINALEKKNDLSMRSERKPPQTQNTHVYSGCHNCGAKDHYIRDCPNRRRYNPSGNYKPLA